MKESPVALVKASQVHDYERPSLWNIMSRVLKATGFTRLQVNVRLRDPTAAINSTY